MVGLYGPGMHGFILDELELGSRVAMALDCENSANWSAIDDLILERDMQNDMDGAPTPPEWIQAVGEGRMVPAEGNLEEDEILRFSVKMIDGMPRPVLTIADAPVQDQMLLLAEAHDTICDTIDAMRAQIARSN